MSATDYAEKPSSYFSHARTQIESLLPEYSPRTLEVGCGDGSTLVWLKESGRTGWTAGAELFADAAAVATSRLDWAAHADIERVDLDLPKASIDLLLCLDVLEHTRDPWDVLRRLTEYVTPNGTIIVSLPNVRHWSVSWPLLRHGSWEYTREGLLDRTHLRFFTRHSIEQMLQGAGYTVTQIARPSVEAGRTRLLNRLTGGLFIDLLAFQYIVSARHARSER